MKQTALFRCSVLSLILALAGVPAFGVRHVSSTPRLSALDSRLLKAIQRSDSRAVRVLLHQGANPNVQFSTESFASFIDSSPVDTIRQDALGLALSVYDVHHVCPNTDIVTALLEHGASVTHGIRHDVLVHKGVFMSARNKDIHHQDNDFYVDFYYVPAKGKSRSERRVSEGFIANRRQLNRLLYAAVKAGALRY